MSKKVCLMVLVGLPAAGKTTFCNWLLQTPQKHFNIIHFCYDDFLEFHQLPPHESSSTLEFVYKAQRAEIFKILEKIANSLTDSKNIPPAILQKIKISEHPVSTGDYIILCDDNHYYRSMRYKIYQLCKAQSYAYAQVYFECDQELSLKRNAERTLKTRLPDQVITQMATRLEAPLSSNTWEMSTSTLNASKLIFSIDSVLLLAFKAFEDISEVKTPDESVGLPADKKEETSSVHKLDIKLRRRITEVLKSEPSKEGIRFKAIQLNVKRKKILRQCRKDVCMDDSELDKYVNLLNANIK